MSSAFFLTHEDGQREIIRDPIEAIRKFLVAIEEEETAQLECQDIVLAKPKQ